MLVGANPQKNYEVYDNMMDEAIVEAARQGNVGAQEYLINKYKTLFALKPVLIF